MTIEQKAEEYANQEGPAGDHYATYHYSDIRSIIKDAFMEGAQSGWVKVTPETMPEPGNSVIVAYQFGVGECRFYTGKFINLVMDCEMPGVTHWMPLPSKPII